MTDVVVEVFPEGPVASSVVVTSHPVAATVAPLPGPVAAATTNLPRPLVSAVDYTPSGIAAVASGAEGIELIVHPRT